MLNRHLRAVKDVHPGSIRTSPLQRSVSTSVKSSLNPLQVRMQLMKTLRQAQASVKAGLPVAPSSLHKANQALAELFPESHHYQHGYRSSHQHQQSSSAYEAWSHTIFGQRCTFHNLTV